MQQQPFIDDIDNLQHVSDKLFSLYRPPVNRKVRRALASELRLRGKGIYWGGITMPLSLGQFNYLLVGSVGSGKTINLRLFMQSILPHIGQGYGLKAVISDPKREIIPIIRGINPTCPLYILNPFDKRHYAWAIARDIYERAHAESLAYSFAPDANAMVNQNDFWRKAFIFIVLGVVMYFINNAKDDAGNPTWTLRDIILAPRSLKQLYAILDSDPETKQFLEPLSGGRMTQSILTTILVYLNQFAVIAALWEQSERHISLREFDQPGHEGILILGRDVENMAVMASLNQLILTRLGQIQLMRPEDPSYSRLSDVFWILDEFHTLSALPEFEEVATTGRSKGISLVIAFQSISSLIRIYGYEATNAIISQFRHRGILSLNDTYTAEYFANLIGSGDRFSQVYHSGNLIETEGLETVPIVSASDLSSMELPNKATGQGLTGFYRADYYNYWYTMPSSYISKHLIPKDKLTPDYQRIDSSYQHLQPWDYDDIRRLKLDRVLSPDEFAVCREEQDHQAKLLGDASMGGESISAILKKLDVDYRPKAIQDDLIEENTELDQGHSGDI
ncbi:type IV secretory system conjugative DNA transfer family protein [Adonisia turfae]|uniref:Type IV secretion system coupling protein TraD DNA-binding domain-containing protein n=1 Tax=Adonisia turfae CCMR0081 TaxID=2292702 RepID=A0A6M0RYT5_9CYAN|nr:type IV secretion system DNA-binding domain-containing protein [Adonisia turfae]NEZ61043.1 hypothetical protein [Adonisia turfae CCMR0081]